MVSLNEKVGYFCQFSENKETPNVRVGRFI